MSGQLYHQGTCWDPGHPPYKGYIWMPGPALAGSSYRQSQLTIPGLDCLRGTCCCLDAVENWLNLLLRYPGKCGPGDMTAGELTLPSASCSILERGAGHCRTVREPAKESSMKKLELPLVFHVVSDVDKEELVL